MRFDLNRLVQWMSSRAHRRRWPYFLYPRAVANENHRNPRTVVDCIDRRIWLRQIHFRTPAFSSDRDIVLGLLSRPCKRRRERSGCNSGRLHQLPDLVVDAVSPVGLLFWRQASTFCKAPLKKSASSVLSAISRFSCATCNRSSRSLEFSGGPCPSSIGSS